MWSEKAIVKTQADIQSLAMSLKKARKVVPQNHERATVMECDWISQAFKGCNQHLWRRKTSDTNVLCFIAT
ncbi:hypothetical protein Y032_0336g2882 [Ancylostoma ceylanicum]|uniref:Uncharacterized protein n=1 Tax=Ancylostoma ceylanicum TaxID=53326 RepID=A0A016RYD8_9BILA|nr:hypothetical protein Y032_0336g2882 [Ancylostoma ceylanicum]